MNLGLTDEELAQLERVFAVLEKLGVQLTVTETAGPAAPTADA